MLDSFADELWGHTGAFTRSREVTPLYAQRYAGPRAGRPRYGPHDYWEMTVVFASQGQLLLRDGAEYAMTPGACILVPPGVSHAEYATQKLDTIWIALRGSRLDGLEKRKLLVVDDRALWRPAEALWIRGARQHGLIGPELDGLSAVLFAAFLQALSDAELPQDGRDGIDAAIEYMQRKFARKLSVGDLAHRFGYSEGHFHRCFKSRTGQTPAQFLARARVGHAMHALTRSTQSVAQIATHCGFSDPQYFSRAFKKVTGMSPVMARRAAES